MHIKTVIREIPGKGRALRGRAQRGGNRHRRSASRRSKPIDESRFINRAQETREETYTPSNSFADFDIHPKLKALIAGRGFEAPTPIQDQTIPHVLAGTDVVGLANTGTGKTAAFLIPLINKVAHDKEQKIIILAPTRELAIQIERDFQGLSRGSGILSVCCVGGAPIRYQLRSLDRGFNFIVGTPGRVKDLVKRRKIDLNGFNTIVLDEADRMLDMGFIEDMRFVMSGMPTKRHTLFFSATLSNEIKRLINEFLTKPATISVKTSDTAMLVDQDVVRIHPSTNKFDVLHELLGDPKLEKVLVFGRTKLGVERLARDLARRGVSAVSIHGDKEHRERHRALREFTENSVTVLVATDVAARGLHIEGVTHVINYDIPETYEDYVHRIGRTGRAGKTGKALTFIERR